jgi:hypothetical protein
MTNPMTKTQLIVELAEDTGTEGSGADFERIPV